MNRGQKYIVLFGLLVMCVMVLYPPWKTTFSMKGYRITEPAHGCLFNPPAENLLWNGYTDGVLDNFAAREDTVGNVNRIGVYRVLAKYYKNRGKEHQVYVNKVRDVFLNPQNTDRNTAIETLGKLEYSEHLPEIIAASESNTNDIKPFSRWVLANSGDSGDEANLAELLKYDNPAIVGNTSYAVRFMNSIDYTTYTLLEECAVKIPVDDIRRIYVISALFVHSSQEDRDRLRKELIVYLTTEKEGRYEACEAFGYNGELSDIEVLEKMIDDSE